MVIYKRGRGFELGTTENNFQQVTRAELEPGTAGLRVRRADHSATLPPPKKVVTRFHPPNGHVPLSRSHKTFHFSYMKFLCLLKFLFVKV